MAFPLALPVIAKGAAALSAALGLTAVVTSNKNEHSNSGNTERLNNAFVQQNLPLMIATNVAKAKMQQPATTNIPTAENALVLRPEYRTETYVVPDEYIPIKSIIEVHDSQGNRKFVDDSNLYDHAENVPDPKKPKENDDKNPQKNDNKKPFWKTTTGKVVKWGLIGGASASALPWVGGGVYRYFNDYIPYALSKTIDTSEFNNSSTEIDKEAYFKDSGGVYTVE